MHQLSEDTLVDLKFIMADTGFGKTFIYDRIKDGTLPKPQKIHGRSRWLYRDHQAFKKQTHLPLQWVKSWVNYFSQ